MKTSKILALLAVASLSFSCAKEFETTQQLTTEKGQITLTAGLDASKVALGEKTGTTYPLTWSEGDYLVLDGVKSNALTAQQAGTAGASFTFEGSFSAPYNVIYGGKEGTADVVVFPANQSYTEGTFAPFCAPFYGTGNVVSTIKMQSLNAALRIPLVEGGPVIKKIMVEAVGGEILAGEFTLGKKAGAFDGSMTAPAEGGKPYVTLDCGEGVDLAEGAKAFFVTIPAGAYSQGVKIYIVNADKQAMILTVSNLKNAAAGKVYELPEKSFVAGNTYVIATADDMYILPTIVSTFGQDKEVILIDDIDMTGKEWVSFGSGSSVYGNGNFSGVLDGKGHRISGLTVPLFGNFAGKLKNITVEANINWSSIPESFKGSTYGLGIIAGYATNQSPYNKGTEMNNVTVEGSLTIDGLSFTRNMTYGGFVGCSNAASIINCTNKAKLNIKSTVTPASSGIVLVGGIVGHVQTDDNTFTGNTNEGEIICNLSTGGTISTCGVGGVAGRLAKQKSGVVVKDLKNTGKITITGSAEKAHNFYAAGVVAYYSIANDAQGWVNEGDIHYAFNDGLQTGNYLGGLVGRAEGANVTYKSFRNDGTLYVEDGFKFAYSAVGGVISHVKNNSTYDSLVNNGDIVFNPTLVSVNGSHMRAGGVIGQIENIASATVKNCTNNGDIQIKNGNTTTGSAYGGVIGNVKCDTFTGTGNLNTGNITYDGTSTSGALHMGGVYGRIEVYNNGTKINLTGLNGAASNTGKIYLNDKNGVSKTPAAGGIIGSIYGYYSYDPEKGTTIKTISFDISGFINEGDIDRKVSNYTYASTTYTEQYAGGIIGNISTEIGGTVTNCSNSGTIQFSKNDGTGTALSTSSQWSGMCGGIIGRALADNNLIVKNCHNSGNIPAIEGYCGGIVAYASKTTITGEKGKYCTNTGDIAHRESDPNAYPQTTSGGILGGAAGDGVVLEWCYNTGTVAGNGGTSGLVGRPSSNTAVITMTHCKSFSKINCVSNWAKSGFILGYTAKIEDPNVLLEKISDIAVGGQFHYGSSAPYNTLTADNFVEHLYYNKTTASAKAQESAPATTCLTAEQAAAKGFTLWDGSSAISWEN